jgi:ATP phosphoribosyltransferase
MLCRAVLCSDLVVVHEALGFGQCHLALGVPMGGKFADVASLEQLRDMPCWTEETPLRVVTGVLTAKPQSGTL